MWGGETFVAATYVRRLVADTVAAFAVADCSSGLVRAVNEDEMFASGCEVRTSLKGRLEERMRLNWPENSQLQTKREAWRRAISNHAALVRWRPFRSSRRLL